MDVVLAGGLFANATISSEHAIALSAVRPGIPELVAQLLSNGSAGGSCSGNIEFFWLVPESAYNSFAGQQPFIVSGKRHRLVDDVVKTLFPDASRLRQFVLLVPTALDLPTPPASDSR